MVFINLPRVSPTVIYILSLQEIGAESGESE